MLGKRPILAGWLPLLIVWTSTVPALANVPKTPGSSVVAVPRVSSDAFAGLMALVQAGNCDTLLKRLAEPDAAATLGGAAVPTRVRVLEVAASCAVLANQSDLALKFAMDGTALANGSPYLWHVRVWEQWSQGDHAGAVASIETLARVAPASLDAIPIEVFYDIANTLKNEKAAELRRRVLKVLADPAYVPVEPDKTGDYFRYDYAKILAGEGDKAGAAAMLARLQSQEQLLFAGVAPGLRDLIPADFDARAAIEHDLAREKQIADAHRDLMEPVISIAHNYLQLGEAERALEALQSVRPASGDTQPYTDQKRMTGRWADYLASTYRMLGRTDDAIAAFKLGLTVPDLGSPINVNQSIDFAQMLNEVGRPAEALQALEPVSAIPKALSPFGEVQFRLAHGCASAELGKTADAQADLAFVIAHRDLAASALLELYACMGTVDDAAAAEIHHLEQPDTVAEALFNLGDFAPAPAGAPITKWRRMLAKLKQRPDVQAAIARAGGIRRYNIPPPS